MKRLQSAGDAAFDRIYRTAIAVFLALTVLTGVLLVIRQRRYVPVPDDAPPFTDASETLQKDFERDKNPETGTPGSYNFLVLGVDRVAGLSDTVMMVSVSHRGEINVVQLPRDTYTEPSAVGFAVSGGVKLNSLYASLGVNGMKSFLEKTLCVKLDYTVVIGTDVFADAIDAIGGVEVDVPCDMDYEDPEQDLYIHIKAGKQTLNGKQAEGFVRFRSGYATGDLGRLEAQKLFMRSLLKTLKENVGPKKAAELAEKLLPAVSADLSLKDCLWFTELVLSPSSPGTEGLSMTTMPGKAVYSEKLKSSYYVLGRNASLDTVNRLLNIYKEKIPDGIFDRNRAFLRNGDDDFERVYTYAVINPGEILD
ncbi:MAG: LCP family protein [Clostridia bacterium]|nr:LCP family protein [Clostridia bacterium]